MSPGKVERLILALLEGRDRPVHREGDKLWVNEMNFQRNKKRVFLVHYGSYAIFCVDLSAEEEAAVDGVVAAVEQAVVA